MFPFFKLISFSLFSSYELEEAASNSRKILCVLVSGLTLLNIYRDKILHSSVCSLISTVFIQISKQ